MSQFEFYEEGASANAETVVLLPGVDCGAYLFREAVPLFLPAYKVVLFNNPGIEGVPVPPLLNVEKIADQVIAGLKKHGLKKCHLFGHSMGGYVAQTVALKEPELVDKLVLVSTSLGGAQTIRDAERVVGELKGGYTELLDYSKKGYRKRISYCTGEVFYQKHKKEFDAFVDFYYEHRSPRKLTAQHFICAAKFSLWGEVQRIQHATLVMHGDEDHLIDMQGGQDIAAYLADARFLQMKGVGHFPMAELKDFYVPIKKFLSGEDVGVKVVHKVPRHKAFSAMQHNLSVLGSVFKGMTK